MNRSIWAIFTFVILIFLSACDSNSRVNQEKIVNWMRGDKLKVLTTTQMIEDVVQAVGSDKVAVISLIQGDLDPHSYQLVKGDDEKLSQADIIFYNGLGLEHGPSLREYLQNSPKTHSVGEFLKNSDQVEIIDVDGQLDPHVWMDVKMWSEITPYVVQVLTEKLPAEKEFFAQNGQKLIDRLDIVDSQIKNMMQAIAPTRRYLVTSHDAFNYFVRAYMADKEELKNGSWTHRLAAPEGLAPESQLSTTNISEVIDYLFKNQVTTIFTENNLSQDSINKLAIASREMGLDLKIAKSPLFADSMGPDGSDADTYEKMMLHNAYTIRDGLSSEGGSDG